MAEPEKRRRTEPTPLWLTPRDLRRVDRAAEFMGCSRSELIRNAIRMAAFEKAARRG